MDPYEAILEQLKRAQQRSLEAFTNRLDFVIESLEGLIQEAKESVQEALPSEPEELFPTTGVIDAVATAREQVEAIEERAGQMVGRIQEMERRMAAAETGAVAAGPAGLGLELLRQLDRARSQSELLRELLPVLAEHGGRAVVLVVREGRVSAWSGVGFADGERLRRWQALVDDSEVLGRALDEGVSARFAPARDPVFAGWLEGEEATGEAVLIPVALRGRVVGAVYLDRAEDRPWRPELAQASVAVACWLIDTLGLRATVPSPTLAEMVDVGAIGAAPPVAEPEPTPAAGYPAVREEEGAVEVAEEEVEAAAEEAGTFEEEPAAAEVVAEEPVEEVEEEVAEEPIAPTVAPGYDPSVTMRVEIPAAEEEVAEEPEEAVEEPEEEAVAEEAEEPEEAAPESESPPPVQPITPPPVQPVVPPPPRPKPAVEPGMEGLSPEERSQHEEARRFARLLVSEIKLYNEDEVDQGRRNRDLYQRLKEDIDRSREMFEKRVPPAVRQARDYFQEELVRILADGDADALGM